ncbi:MAG: 30S ribosomal protein S20 [Candidatus Omnitrophica bacterium]|jgi:small subunit ribosomal protein S20|nr:30S ribosomal protein S20 [Candidatus Omnitrophota bacterium]
MPQRRAAKKDLRQNAKNRERNLNLSKQLKTALKKFKKTLEEKDAAKNKEALSLVYKIIDKAASKNIIHPKKASRKKSQLARLINAPAKS